MKTFYVRILTTTYLALPRHRDLGGAGGGGGGTGGR